MTKHADKPSLRIDLDLALREHAPILANLLELYAHDFSEFHRLDVGADGRFGYKSLPLYWSEPNRYPFLVRVDGKLAGLALVKRGSEITGNPTIWDMAEFFVLRGCRRRGIGTLAAQKVWRRFPGPWEVRVMQSNFFANLFWERAISHFPGRDKKFFYIFDFCQNLDFFSHDSEATEGSAGDSLSKRIFCHRVDLIAAVDKLEYGSDSGLRITRQSLVDGLRNEIAGMSLDNFLVRPRRAAVERFSIAEAWQTLSVEGQTELKAQVAGLPSSVNSGGIEAKQFDLLVLRTQLALLRGDAFFADGKRAIINIARRLASLTTIPAVAAQLTLIQEVQSDEFWQDVTLPLLENVRRAFRDLVRFIPPGTRPVVVSDFEDLLGDAQSIRLPGISPGVDSERVRQKALRFLQGHGSDPTIHKLRWNEPLTSKDVESLEAIFQSEGASEEEIESIRSEDGGFGLFLRSLGGLDRHAAKAALPTS